MIHLQRRPLLCSSWAPSGGFCTSVEWGRISSLEMTVKTARADEWSRGSTENEKMGHQGPGRPQALQGRAEEENHRRKLFVSDCYCNNTTIYWCKTTHIYYLTVLEIGSLQWVCKAACALEAPEEHFLALFSFQKPPTAFGSWPPSSVFKASSLSLFPSASIITHLLSDSDPPPISIPVMPSDPPG